MTEHDATLQKLMEYKTKLEEYEADIQRNEAKRDALLEQAKQRYGTNSFAELETYREKVYAQYQSSKENADKYNAKLESFFATV
jgi:hypothetical protein